MQTCIRQLTKAANRRYLQLLPKEERDDVPSIPSKGGGPQDPWHSPREARRWLGCEVRVHLLWSCTSSLILLCLEEWVGGARIARLTLHDRRCFLRFPRPSWEESLTETNANLQLDSPQPTLRKIKQPRIWGVARLSTLPLLPWDSSADFVKGSRSWPPHQDCFFRRQC